MVSLSSPKQLNGNKCNYLSRISDDDSLISCLSRLLVFAPQKIVKLSIKSLKQFYSETNQIMHEL